jgi:organic hydroperoxide reductase OsmC/OhrA
MAGRTHTFAVTMRWTGDLGAGTSGYRAYSRDHEIAGSDPASGKPAIPGSSDASFRGDAKRWNPEELLVGALSACHQLWYLHLCAVNGVVVRGYEDEASGVMEEEPSGAGQFTVVTLRPRVTIAAGCDADVAHRLHEEAHAMCFIARSVTFPVKHEPDIRFG